MNFFRSVKSIFFLQCVVFLEALCEKTRHSLVITIKDNNMLELTRPIGYHNDYEKIEFETPEDGKTYHFCPLIDAETNLEDEVQSRMILEPIEFIPPNSKTNDENRCQHPNRPMLLQVENPNELKSNWNDNINLYHFAYVLKIEHQENEKISQEEVEKFVKPKYASWASNYHSVLGIEIFFNKNTKQTVAVSYKLLSVQAKKKWIEYPLFYYKAYPMLRSPNFMKYIDEENGLKFLKQKLGKKEAKYRVDREDVFALAAFAPSPHFATGLWAMSSLVQLNLFPMWAKTYARWMYMEKFIDRVASSLGDLTITSGVIGTMQLPISKPKHEGNKSPDSTKLEGEVQQESTEWISLKEEYDDFEIPKYAWKAVEFNDHGILIVMHLDPFFSTLEKICENDVGETNGWTVSNSDFSTGEIYCCNMTMEYIAKLEVNFLSLEERKPFMLKTDSENKFILSENL